jgi:DNA-binding response OmpR family regulator
VRVPRIYLAGMAANSILLCIHRDPAQLTLLRENGYELVTATNGSEGLRLLRSRPVDAIVLEYHLGLLDGAVVAAEIKKFKPQLPIVMLADDLELPEGALKSVDAIVTKSDGPHFLWATVHFVLSVRPTQRRKETLPAQKAAHLRRPGRSRVGAIDRQADAPLLNAGMDVPFSPGVWRGIRTGRVRF